MTPMLKIPYDPDFDPPTNEPSMSGNKSGFFSNASPKLTFVFGVVLGLAVISFIGFIILLVERIILQEVL